MHHIRVYIQIINSAYTVFLYRRSVYKEQVRVTNAFPFMREVVIVTVGISRNTTKVTLSKATAYNMHFFKAGESMTVK